MTREYNLRTSHMSQDIGEFLDSRALDDKYDVFVVLCGFKSIKQILSQVRALGPF